MNYAIKSCGEKHLPEILEIFNGEILNSTAIYEYRPLGMDNIRQWFADKNKLHYPVLGVFNPAGMLMGFGTYGSFRARPAYKYTIEHSVYIRPDQRGNGLGKMLLKEIIDHAAGRDYHVLIGGIDASNSVSIALHESFGFVHAGTIRQAAFKFGRWLDLAFYQLTLQTPTAPVEG